MEKIFSKAAAIAIPYSILGIACKASGHNGGAALTSGFRSLGGTFGMKGGLVTLGTIGLAAEFVTEKTIGIVLNNAVKNLCFEGESQETIFSKIDKYPISKELKLKLKETVRQYSVLSSQK